jgi:hypothetical protein
MTSVIDSTEFISIRRHKNQQGPGCLALGRRGYPYQKGECTMFGLAAFAMPLVGNMLGGILGGLANQGGHGCHGHHHHHDHNNLREAAQDFRMAQQDYRDAQQDFSQGNVFGGLSELAEARQHEADGLSHLNGGGWI